MLKDRVIELRVIRDQARADAERAEGALDRLGPSITPQALKTFARQARKRMRTESGRYRRDHLRALAQRVEVDAKEVRTMGSKSVLLRTLVAAASAKTAGFGVPSFVPKWRPMKNPTKQRPPRQAQPAEPRARAGQKKVTGTAARRTRRPKDVDQKTSTWWPPSDERNVHHEPALNQRRVNSTSPRRVATQGPAGMGLTADVGLRGVMLGVQGVEVLLKPIVGGDAGVDGAADRPRPPHHGRTSDPGLSRRPKNK
jgi:hypothetical protein